MNPLRVLLVHRDQAHRWNRIDGQFAYDVPEFTVAHCAVDKTFRFDLGEVAGRYDLVWWDEGKHRDGPFFSPPPGQRRTPVAYYCLYPTLTTDIFEDRKRRARENADLVLLEHDRIERWEDIGIPVRRCAYSVNEWYYRDNAETRDIDVGFFSVWNYSPERRALNDWLAGYCAKHGWAYATNGGYSTDEYPQLLARSKVVIHINRTPDTRPPRIFDASACGAAVLASRMPAVSGERWIDGIHYVAFDEPVAQYHLDNEHGDGMSYTDEDCQQVAAGLDWLMENHNWAAIAHNAQQYVLSEHTWRVRARQLRQTFAEALGI